MDRAQVLLEGLWEPFSFLPLFGYSCLGLLLGAVAGLLLTLQLQRRGLLARRNRWHHWLLKLYFLLLPVSGAFLGVQAGLLYGGQQQVHRHLDSYAPLIQGLADDVWQDFSNYLQAQDQQVMTRELQNASVQTVLSHMAAQYLQAQLLIRAPQLDDASLSGRIGLKLFGYLQASLLSAAVRETAVEQANKYVGVDPQVMFDVLDARVEQLFHADFLLGLLKRQLAQVLKPFYLTLLALLGLLLALVGAELWLSRRLRQWLTQEQVSKPLVHAQMQ
jgi:hypothetical protein